MLKGPFAKLFTKDIETDLISCLNINKDEKTIQQSKPERKKTQLKQGMCHTSKIFLNLVIS